MLAAEVTSAGRHDSLGFSQQPVPHIRVADTPGVSWCRHI